ncbi:aspartate aminotransferase family protein [Rhizobium binae]|uniref:aspartate aminotransferase family protein n=1 Tax=Rhizobium binae TaxID=1138190 RepID=UPI001A98683D|nr:aspartate aminotransferase family protein [Rhizobium binae]MBX4994847.1 aspartate aminotransferase family protein [Rhizobium binae]QSY85370.1 aspartate aminotransferase family protein [Rhizobium binae]
MSNFTRALHAGDIAFHLHSYTNARAHEEAGPLAIERGEGVFVYDTDGRRYIEAMAGLWSVALGFDEPRLVEAAIEQMRKLPFYHTFTHKTHQPAIELAEKLISLAPVPMSKVHFTNSGSEANDTVVKMVRYYNNARDLPRKKKIISRIGAYHGVTVAAASLTGLPNNHRAFDLPLPNILHTLCPHYYRFAEAGETETAFIDRLAREFEALIEREGPDTVAAFIGEPVMAAGGVIVPPTGYWSRIQEICRRYDILLVADEVVCGFGRTGSMFGCTTFGIEPDIMVLSKQLSSSYQPLAAVLINDKVYQQVASQSAAIGTFGHGFTASGHPVATAVALENIRLIEERGLVENAKRMGKRLLSGLSRYADHSLVGEIRGIGFIAAVELVADKSTKARFDPAGRVGAYFNACCQSHGMIVRNIGDSIAFCPPLIAKEGHVDQILDCFSKALEDTDRWTRS